MSHSLSQTNTFQGLLITDGISSYAAFIYNCSDLQWSDDSVVGYFANDGTLFEEVNSTGIDCRNYPQSQWSSLVLNLGEQPAETKYGYQWTVTFMQQFSKLSDSTEMM